MRRASLAHDPQLVARVTRRLDGFPNALHAALAVRDGPFALRPGGRRGEHDVRQLRSLREENLLHHQVIEPREQMLNMMHVGVGLRGFSPMTYTAVSSFRLIASIISVRCQPGSGWMSRPPTRRSNFFALFGDAHVLESRQFVRQRAHVAAALDVVLSP